MQPMFSVPGYFRGLWCRVAVSALQLRAGCCQGLVICCRPTLSCYRSMEEAALLSPPVPPPSLNSCRDDIASLGNRTRHRNVCCCLSEVYGTV